MGSGKEKQLIVLAGPTAVGKTKFAIDLARQLQTEIISADSRQFYKEISIGTAKPTPEELEMVPHHFINNLSIHDYYNVSKFEQEVLSLLDDLFKKHNCVIMVGGSGLYIDAVCKGIDELPDADERLRDHLYKRYKKEGLETLLEELKKTDENYYNEIDKSNPNRILRAMEVILATGRKYSDLRKNSVKERPFKIFKFCLNRDRKELFERISIRVDQMIEMGLVDEVKSQAANRDMNALNTVGYKEIFRFLDGEITLDQAITDLKTNTRRYAKRQMTWFKRDPEYIWLHPDAMSNVLKFIECDI